MEKSGPDSAIFHFKSDNDYLMKIINKLISSDQFPQGQFMSTEDSQGVGYEITGRKGMSSIYSCTSAIID